MKDIIKIMPKYKVPIVKKKKGKKKKTHEEYVAEVTIKNPNIEVIGQYIDAKTKIMHHCLQHDIFWEITPDGILTGRGCKKCKSEKIRNKNNKTHEQYVKELKEINSNISVIEKYVNSSVAILHQCLIDGYQWDAQPNNMLSGFGCPKCSKRFRRTHEDYVRELYDINSNIEVIEQFKGLQTPILHRCKLHKFDWLANPENILNGHGCYKCGNEKAGEKNRKTHSQYIEELKLINPYINVIDTYINANTPILHKCLIDEHEWYAQPANILSGRGCPQCKETNGERRIRLWLEKNNILYESQKIFIDCRDVRPLPFDFYLHNYNIAIEYDGKQHFEPIDYFGGQEAFEKTAKHDNVKNEYCKNNGITLLRIPYFKDVEVELNNFLFI